MRSSLKEVFILLEDQKEHHCKAVMQLFSSFKQLLPTGTPANASPLKVIKAKKTNLNIITAAPHSDSIKFISEALKQFINDELDNSDTSS